MASSEIDRLEDDVTGYGLGAPGTIFLKQSRIFLTGWFIIQATLLLEPFLSSVKVGISFISGHLLGINP